ncbi:MAG: ABC transporter permease [Candidatus Thorarchaeota archaeon]|jgi:peptide/nickel transport system permease protein
MKLRDYVLRRILLSIPVIIGVLAITFVLAYVVGNPIAMYIDEKTPSDAIPGIIAQHGLDQPVYIQFFYYLRDLFSGDWGYSRTAGASVIITIQRFFPATIELSLFAMVIAVGVGIPLGIISATRKDQLADHVTRVISLLGVSMPIFWFALMLKYVLYYQFFLWGLPHMPDGYRYSFIYINYEPITNFILIDSIITGNAVLFFDALLHIAMPAVCLGYLVLAVITRMMRSSMLEVLKEDYITLARSKGLRERVVVYRHALRNAMIPTMTVIGLAFGGLITGAVLTETIFQWPGLGRWATTAILTSDIPSINAFTLLVAFIFVTANLIVDLIYGVLDPRIRFG